MSTGRKCDGYPVPKPQVRPGVLVVATIRPNPPLEGCSRPSQCMVKARKSYYHFTEIYAPMLAGYGTEGFWNSVVLQTSFADESIKHLVIAASSLYSSSVSQVSENSYFLAHYGRALQKLSHVSQPNVTVILVACILLALCDEIRNQTSSAIQHIHAGLRILHTQSMSQISDWGDCMTLSEITSTFSRLSSPRPSGSFLKIVT